MTFDDVSGADEAKYELQEIVEFLKDPKRFSRLGGRIPKGALLVGPPGTGKTLLARAVAGEAGRPFFSMSGSDFVEMFVGVGASRVRDLFEQGKAQAPCIIFIDEIDAVGRHRGAGLGGGHDEREQTLNQLLVEMDGFEANDGVILLAATNRPDVLDPALLRPGRFDRQVVVDAPDVRGREGILRVHLKKVPSADDVEVTTLARGTPGMSGADLANLVNEGALLAARKGHDKVYMIDLEEAKDKVMLGAERKSMVLSDAEKRLTAYHEAGHAVVALRLPGLDPVHKVTIIPRGRALGITASLPEEDRHSYSRDYLLGRLVMLFGGRVAEEMIFGPEKVTTGAGNDIERATAMASADGDAVRDERGDRSDGDRRFRAGSLPRARHRAAAAGQRADGAARGRRGEADPGRVVRGSATDPRAEPRPAGGDRPGAAGAGDAGPRAGGAAGRGPRASPDSPPPRARRRHFPAGPAGAGGWHRHRHRDAGLLSLGGARFLPALGALTRMTFPLAPAAARVEGGSAWRAGSERLPLEKPLVMGILNVTPDSFSDGGAWAAPEEALRRAREMVAAGADLVDVGGESTRPGADPVTVKEEIARVTPVLRLLSAELEVPLSIDTRRAEVAEAALQCGALIVNDVSALDDARMAGVVAAAGAGLVLMHMRGTPATMQQLARYEDVTGEVVAELRPRLQRALDAGVEPEAIVVDPGIGFAKNAEQNLRLLAELPRLAALGRPVLLGVSRKAFLGALLGGLPPTERGVATAAACVAGLLAGARIFRVHDVLPVRQALTVAEAIRAASDACK